MQTPSNSPKQKQYDPDANVYIAGLPRNYNKDKLYKLFSAYGPVLRYKFVSPKDDTKCPYGFVQFSHTICAQQAIKALNGHTISRNKESIEVSIAAVGRRALFKSEEPTNLYIENMPSSWNNDILSSIFGKYGNIIQSKITGNNVAFVRFETHEQALNAINHLHREETEPNKRLTVRFATCQHKKSNNNNNNNNGYVQLQENNSNLNYNMQFQQCHNNMNSNNNNNNNNNNLYIKNLPPTYNQLDLERLFSSFGSISSATIINDSIGVAFVRYKDAENAKRAVKELNGTKPELFEKEIVVKYAHSDIDKEKNINNMQYIHNFNDFMLTNTNKHKHANTNKNKNKNEYIVCGYIRNHQRLFCTRFNILNISEIINKYFGGEDNENENENENENDIDNDSCFDDLLSRINTFDNILEIMQNNIYGINNKINNLLYESEQKRMYKMNFMQKRFTDIIANLYHKMNNQLQNMANVLQENVEKENLRIKSLEKQIRYILDLNMFRDRDMSKIQNKINNSDIDRFESDKVRIWLKDIVHLEQYYNVFISNGYDDMESIADITDNDLVHIGIDKIGHKKKLIKYAKKLGFQGCFKQFEMNGININYIRYDSPSITNTFDSV